MRAKKPRPFQHKQEGQIPKYGLDEPRHHRKLLIQAFPKQTGGAALYDGSGTQAAEKQMGNGENEVRDPLHDE